MERQEIAITEQAMPVSNQATALRIFYNEKRQAEERKQYSLTRQYNALLSDYADARIALQAWQIWAENRLGVRMGALSDQELRDRL